MVKKMNAREEFLIYIYQTCEMGVKSTTDLIALLSNKENKISENLNRYLKEYEEYFHRAEGLIKEANIDIKKSSMMSKIMSSIGINMEVMKDNSDPKIADMLIQGYTMGTLEITKKLKKYKDYINKEERKLAEELNKTQENNIKELKKFL